MQNMEQKKRQLEESHDSLMEEFAKLNAQGLCDAHTFFVPITCNLLSQNNVILYYIQIQTSTTCFIHSSFTICDPGP